MYDNIGEKIKWLAKFIAIAGIIVSVISGLIIFIGAITGAKISSFFGSSSSNNGTVVLTGFLTGILYMVVGSLISWISSWFLYGFGELIENTAIIAENTSDMSSITTYDYAEVSRNTVETAPILPKQQYVNSDSDDSNWRCPCGEINKRGYDYCSQCGEYRW